MRFTPAKRLMFSIQKNAKENGDHQPTIRKYTAYAQGQTHADASYRMESSALENNGAEV
jgi:hypothetical protein